jgi:rhomboid protease GluP
VRVTSVLIALNVIVYVWEMATGAFSSDMSLVDHGALVGVLVRQGEWWRIVSGAFLHAGLLHIGLNMFALYQVGRLLEALAGPSRILAIYIVAMIGSGLAVVQFQGNVPTVGASGAIFGLFGALVAVGLRLGRPGRTLVMQVVPIIVINLIFGFSVPNISNAGHIGGLVSGFLAGLAFFMTQRAAFPVEATAYDATTGEQAQAELLPPEEAAQ